MRSTTRRTFLSAVVAAGIVPLVARAVTLRSSVTSPSQGFRLRLGSRDHHHLCYHMDAGVTFSRCEAPAGMEQILEESVGYFRRTAVNLFEFYISGYEVAHDLGIDPHVGPGADAPYRSAIHWRMHENLKHHLKRGGDPIAEIIKATRQLGVAFFIGCRMNDLHHLTWGWHPKLWVDHPEYRINEVVSWDKRWSGALDYGQRAVREDRKRIISAYLDRYDTDGVELDFNRFPVFFKSKQIDKHRDMFTGYMREIRDLVEQASVKRGHRIYLMVRAPSVPRQCHKIGLDVLRWMRDELVDITVCAHPRYAEFEMPVEEFLEASQGRKVLLFAGFDPRLHAGAGREHSLLTPEMWRAIATHYWKAGVDGLHLFNNSYYRGINLQEPHLKEIASPATLERANKEYQVTRRLKEAHMAEYESYISYPEPLPVDLTVGQTARTRIFMDDALANRPSIALRLRMDGMTPPDRFRVSLNGQSLPNLERTPYAVRGSRGHPQGSYAAGEGMLTQWVQCAVSNLEWMREGANLVEVTLEKRNPAVAAPLVLSNVELDVQYSR